MLRHLMSPLLNVLLSLWQLLNLKLLTCNYKQKSVFNMTDLSNKIIHETKCYVTENWGSPFIVAFMLFLLGTAISLSFNLSNLANSFSIYAFYALVIGVILQLVCFLKNKKESNVAEGV